VLREHDHVTADAVPMVGIVVVNYFGGDRTSGCLESLTKLTWPSERLVVCLVDNGSEPGWADGIRRSFPAVRVVEAHANLGFGGGCNLGIASVPECDHVALLNNDAVPDPGWLEPLVEALDADPRCGAATPKVLLEGTFVTLRIRSTSAAPGGGDRRPLGVQLCGISIDGLDVTEEVELVSGFWGWEHDATTVGGTFAWTDGDAIARVALPASSVDGEVAVRLASGEGPKTAHVSLADAGIAAEVDVEVDIHPAWSTVGPSGPGTAVVNNAGTVLLPDGSTADRGYLQPDDGTFDEPCEVWGWSGAAVLLARRYLDDVGTFDARFFLYAEDADLAWRGRLRGWRYRYVPTSVVWHEHSATTGARSPLTRHLAARNRLVMLTKDAPRDLLLPALRDEVRELSRAVRRDVLVRLVRFRRPVLRHAVHRSRVLLGFARLAPHALRARRANQPDAKPGLTATWMTAVPD
jgi:GT2 family glycosyltransferase